MPLRCDDRRGQGGPDRWANAYFFLRDLAVADGLAPRIAFGGDWNGFAGWPGPRINTADGCKPRKAGNKETIKPEMPLGYPITLPPTLSPAALGGTPALELFEWPAGRRSWDYRSVGVAHIGMLPDFVQNLRQLGLTLGELEPVYRSAREVVNIWELARKRDVPGDRHSVRWVPDSPFDVLLFEYHDGRRDVLVSDEHPICKPRGSDAPGYVRDGRCVKVTPASPFSAPADASIVAYHSGRCLDLDSPSAGGRIVQRRCSEQPRQTWTLTHTPDRGLQIRNGSGLCLTASAEAHSRGTRVTQQPCSPDTAQHWTDVRSGNTFSLRAAALDLCLDVDGESREDGAAVRLQPCTGASDQLWSIEALRGNDFERLYQATANAINWSTAATETHPLPVLLGGNAICRSSDTVPWLGVVADAECRGADYTGAPARTSAFVTLFQRP